MGNAKTKSTGPTAFQRLDGQRLPYLRVIATHLCRHLRQKIYDRSQANV